LRSPDALGEGIDALEGMPLSALTQSPRLRLVEEETIGLDHLQRFERR
jgi:diaminohydroxyphosphoribosylaminopyrimidine deaminase/5-amino-6-(5-phosphoribosylamino)uracil reductase